MKKLIYVVALIATFMNCKKNDPLPDPPPTDLTHNQGNTVTRNFNGLILDLSGVAVSNATVTIGSSTVQTNASGSFSIPNASVKERFALIKVTKAGYINGSRVLVPTTGDNRVNIMLIPNTTTNTVASGVASQVSLPNGTKVKFTGAFKDAAGNAYTGNVLVSLYHLKPSNAYLSETMPGSLLATNANGNASVLETFGMLHVELTGSAGQKLNIATGATSEITLEIDAAQAATAPASIPLWSFDETTGVWKEEGSATKIGNTYVGNVSHFSWWNCDSPFAASTLTVTVNNSAGSQLSNVKVEIDTRPTITNSQGQASGLVPANRSLTLVIKDLCGNVIYSTTVGPFATGSINVLPTITLAASAITTTTITGTLQTCTNTNVTNGEVKLTRIGVLNNFFAPFTCPVTNGTFSFTSNICGGSQQFKVVGTDFTNLQSTNDILFTANNGGTTNLGVISTCNANVEFITWKVDNGNTLITTTNITANNTATGCTISIPVGAPFFYFNGPITGNGTYGTLNNNNFSMEFNDANGTNFGLSQTANHNLQFVVSNYPSTIGAYYDITGNGTFKDANNNVHSLLFTIHVKRDN